MILFAVNAFFTVAAIVGVVSGSAGLHPVASSLTALYLFPISGRTL